MLCGNVLISGGFTIMRQCFDLGGFCVMRQCFDFGRISHNAAAAPQWLPRESAQWSVEV